MKINLDTDKIFSMIKTFLKKQSESPSYSVRGLADFITFKSMILPKLIVVIFIALSIWCICMGVSIMYDDYRSNWEGLMFIVLGPLGVHVLLELLMLPFAIINTLRQVRNELQEIRSKIKSEE